MPHAVLRHGGLPSVDASEKRVSAQASNLWTQDLLQFGAHDSDNLVVAERPSVYRVPPGKKTAQQGAVLGSAIGKLVMYESRGQQALAFAARHEKSEARWKRLADATTVAQADRDGRAVLNRSQFGGKFGAGHAQHLRRRRRGQRDDDGVELVGLQSS